MRSAWYFVPQTSADARDLATSDIYDRMETSRRKEAQETTKGKMHNDRVTDETEIGIHDFLNHTLCRNSVQSVFWKVRFYRKFSFVQPLLALSDFSDFELQCHIVHLAIVSA